MLAVSWLQGQETGKLNQQIRFESQVDLVNVTVTVTDTRGRFVNGLRKDDFILCEDGRPQPVAFFSADRVPVSLGLAIDTSGSMAGEKIASARAALNRFFGQLLAPTDEIFLYRFDDEPRLIQGWTTDREALRQALGAITPKGGTCLYDTLAEAVPLAQTGTHVKKALVIISDGNDTASESRVPELKRLIRESEVLVYALGIDARAEPTRRVLPPLLPVPLPPKGGPGRWLPIPPGGRGPVPVPPRTPPAGMARIVERVNVEALRELTDDSGGRTEVIRTAEDLHPATAGVADELSRQYYLGYHTPSPRDGRWHAIRVEVKGRHVIVRARRGFVATP